MRGRGRALCDRSRDSTGPAYGLLLDQAEPAWRTGIDAEKDLGEMLGHAMGDPLLRHAEGGLEGRLRRYDGAAVREQERERAQRLAMLRREMTALLVDGPVLEVPMQDARISFNPRNVLPLPPHGTVYPGGTVTAAWGTLETAEGQVLIGTDWQKAFVAAGEAVTVDRQARTATGPGWVLRFEPGWRVQESAGRYVVVRD